MKIAVGGSAANPPHNGHKELLQFILTRFSLFDKVIWIPSGDRNDKEIEVHPDHRIAMTELLIEQNWRTGVNTLPLIIKYDEIYGEAKTTFDRLNELKKELPNDELIWFTGSDSNISRWYNGEKLLRENSFYIIPRESFEINYYHYRVVGTERIDIEDKYAPISFGEKKVYIQDMEKLMEGISSTAIRKAIKEGNSWYRSYIPQNIYQYIKENNLYK